MFNPACEAFCFCNTPSHRSCYSPFLGCPHQKFPKKHKLPLLSFKWQEISKKVLHSLAFKRGKEHELVHELLKVNLILRFGSGRMSGWLLSGSSFTAQNRRRESEVKNAKCKKKRSFLLDLNRVDRFCCSAHHFKSDGRDVPDVQTFSFNSTGSTEMNFSHCYIFIYSNWMIDWLAVSWPSEACSLIIL